VLAARRVERLEATRAIVAQASRRAIAVAADMALPEDALAVVEAAMKEFGRVDVLVNNAGKGTAVPATRETPEQFREVIDINLNGCYWMAQACGRVMRPGSAIINIASVAALASGGLPQAAYSASKAGLIGLTRDLAVQWTGRKGIRVTALAPGYFPSEMTDQFPQGYINSQLPRLPAGRPGDPDELAAAVVFLASTAAGYITGTTLVVDGGLTASDVRLLTATSPGAIGGPRGTQRYSKEPARYPLTGNRRERWARVIPPQAFNGGQIPARDARPRSRPISAHAQN
jgi:NAD(P)-dependent dehydrogenase (short-subunit alcohol dehydrogenase family)